MKEDSKIIKISPLALGFKLLLLVFLIDTVYALLFMMFFYFGSLSSDGFSNGTNNLFILFLWAAHTIKFVIIAYFLIRLVTDYLNTDYVVSKTHLKVEKGVINTKLYQYELTQLKELNVFQGPVGRVLHYGDIELQFGALGFHKNVTLKDIAHPHRYHRELKEYLRY